MRTKLRCCLVLLLAILSQTVLSQATGVMTDDRDGQEYKMVTYEMNLGEASKEVSWMAENLRFKTADSQCFNNEEANCQKNGRLYNWFEAMQACPAGWRLPSDEDWTALVDLFGGIEKAGKHLKANKKAWTTGKGTNKSQFNGMPTGASDPNGFYHEQAGFFWSATLSDEKPNEASDWSFVPWLNEMRHWYGTKEIGNAVRCVKD